MVLIEGNNIFLRTPILEDANKIFHWENDPENAPVNVNSESLTEQEIKAWIKERRHDLFLENDLRFIMCAKDESVAGCIDLFEFDPLKFDAGVGILVEKKFRKQNIATEALLMLKDYSFGKLKLNKLWCHISPGNKASINLFTKCGFSQVERILSGTNNGRHEFKNDLHFQVLNSK